jgi:hypothetical protein
VLPELDRLGLERVTAPVRRARDYVAGGPPALTVAARQCDNATVGEREPAPVAGLRPPSAYDSRCDSVKPLGPRVSRKNLECRCHGPPLISRARFRNGNC